MAEQTVTVPASTIFTDSATEKRYDLNGSDAILLDDDFRRAGYNGADYLRRVIAKTNVSGFELRLVFSPTPTISAANDDLSDEWETYVNALGYTQGANGVENVPGPNHPDNATQDSTETYIWVLPTGAVATGLETFFFTDLDTAADLSVTFRTPEPDVQQVAMAARAGDPTATFNARAVAPVTPEAVAMSARAGNPTAAFDLTLVAEVTTLSGMRQWLERLRLPWANIPLRWKLTEFQADLAQRLVDEASLALREWSPLTCRPQTLQTWGETLRRPQRDGETVDEYRVRLLTWRNELVGTSGWVRDEVERVTGDDPPRVIEFPRDGLKWGGSRWGAKRWGKGPSLTVGVEAVDRADVAAVIEPGVPPKVEIGYLEPDVFDAV